MNPGSTYPYNLELKATKAAAPQALSFRGFFCFRPTGRNLGKGEAATGNKDFSQVIFCL
jgi:hypothetical protein